MSPSNIWCCQSWSFLLQLLGGLEQSLAFWGRLALVGERDSGVWWGFRNQGIMSCSCFPPSPLYFFLLETLKRAHLLFVSCSSLSLSFISHTQWHSAACHQKRKIIKKCKKRKEEKTKEKKKRKENKTQTKPTTITINSSALCITTNPSWARAFEKGLYIFLSEM